MQGIHCGKCDRSNQKGLIKGCKIYERNKLVIEHLNLVGRIAHKFKNCGAPRSDIIQMGHEGLVEAAERFDPNKGTKFYTYAIWWIRAKITRGSTQYRDKPYSSKLAEIDIPLNKFIARIKTTENRYPTPDEIANNVRAVGWSKKQIRIAALHKCRTLKTPVEDIEDHVNPYHLYSVQERLLPPSLDEKERIVIRHRNYEGKTLQETADKLYEEKQFENTPAKAIVSQIEKRALAKIRSYNHA